nr:2083_t:CDS:2 [Entrophospora candida]CAG8441315.1 1265_t:CDS:2 [Entrophospora candida]
MFYKNINKLSIRFIYLKSKSWGPHTGLNKVKLVEISPRQHTKQIVEEETKINFINQLSKTGLKVIEMGDAYELMAKITQESGVDYTATVSNIHELNRAIIANVKDVAIFSSASETFCKKHFNYSIKESLEIYHYLVDRANAENIAVRGHISCALGCPYEGEVKLSTVAKIAEKMYKMGCYEISLGDTIGVGTPAKETVATEDIVYMLNGLNYYTGVNLEKMIEVGNYISQYLNNPNKSKVAIAIAIANNKSIE